MYVTSRFGKGFFAVEGELRIKGEDGKESSMLYDSAVVPTEFWAKTIYQEVLFWMTDSERFRPPRKRKRKPPTWLETHRIFNVRSITPLELFHRKIDAEEYGEALDLAKIYKLDSDLVFQRRWTRSRVTTRTIKDYLVSCFWCFIVCWFVVTVVMTFDLVGKNYQTELGSTRMPGACPRQRRSRKAATRIRSEGNGYHCCSYHQSRYEVDRKSSDVFSMI